MSRLRLSTLCLLLALSALAAPAAAQADFGIQSFSADFTEADESPAIQAGAHPFEYTVHFTMNQDAEERVEGSLRTLVMELPPGLVGDPLSLPRCSRADFDFNRSSICPGNTQVGVADVLVNRGGVLAHPGVYNLTPSPGSPVTLGLVINNNNGYLDAFLRTGGDYGANVTDAALPTREEVQTVTAHIWGLPMARVHDPQRYCIPDDPELAQIVGCSSDALPTPFLSLPTRCGVPLKTTLRVSSVEGDEDEATVTMPPLEGCESPPFAPQIKARPETTAADSPTGLAVTVKIPQTSAPAQLATAHLKDSVVTLPAGLAVNPSAAIGRSACSLAQVDLSGPGPAQCPDASKVGTVEVSSPLVDHPLPGSVYLARQGENPFGSLLALYLTVNDPLTGVVVKQAIKVVPDPLTGQLTAFTENTPQLPFEVLDFNFFGGPRASLTTPPVCGTYTTQTVLTPWTAPQGKAAKPSDAFQITQAPGGGACPASEAQMPAAPGFEAGTTAPLAGAYSPFVMKLTRENGSQRFGSLNLTLPPGLSAKLAGVAECSDPQIAAAEARKNPGEGAAELANPSCPKASEVGTATVGAGSGTPIYVQGHAYLAGPYKGAPLSLVIITPAVAGPFDLGVVVVRSALFIDEATAQVTAKSDPIPQILQGIPLAVRSIAISLDREGFSLNPTNCEAKQIAGQVLSPLGTAAPLTAHFQASGCRRLDFAPNFKLSLLGKNQMRRLGHPALHALLTYPKGPGYANIAKASVTLPAGVFIDNAHINNPCKLSQFAEGTCPPTSVLGSARAYTPLLDKPLEGKVYFRANGGVRELPDVVTDLNGQVHFVLIGATDAIVRGETSRIRNTFAVVPDAPVSKFELNLFGGKRGLLYNSVPLCSTTPRATIKLSAQNGATQNTNPLITTSCAKSKAPRRHRGHR
jgi:hypothetical protein